MICLPDGRPVRRPWTEIILTAAYILVLTAAVVTGVAAMHPSGVGRAALPVLLAVASMHIAVTLRQLVFIWRHVLIPVPVQPKPWPAAEDLDEHFGGGRR